MANRKDKLPSKDLYRLSVRPKTKMTTVDASDSADQTSSEVKQSSKLLVVAIDFGTTYSGYAFSFKHEFRDSPTKINTNQWSYSGTGAAGINLKTPSCLLLHPNRKLHSFGYEAKQKYEYLSEVDEHKDWYFFWQFKMILHQRQDVTGNYEITEENGKVLDALTVFSLSIKYLKDHLLQMIKDSTPDLRESEITWVITVPAIWKDSAKKFMRKAAEKAGLAKDSIEIALEPEAASLYCRHLPITKDPEVETGMTKFPPGTRYMILDCGGGTVDITVHEVVTDNRLKELHTATGGNWGGTKVNNAFTSFITEMVGEDVFENFSMENKNDFLMMLEDFEMKKRMTSPDSDDLVTIRIPVPLQDMFKAAKSRVLADVASNTSFKSDVSIVGDKMRINAKAFRSFFNKPIRDIVNHVTELLEFLPLPIKAILMVGGFSESKVLKKAIKDKFGNQLDVIIPVDASLCVMKGAVIYGHAPLEIAERKCPYTYGVAMTMSFIARTHPSNKKLVIDGEELCDDIFDKHVEVGQTVRTGEAQQEKTYYPLSDNDRILPVILYRSSKSDPKFVDDKHCHFAGKFLVHITHGIGTKASKRPLKVRMIFGGSDIVVEATEKDGKVHKADFSID